MKTHLITYNRNTCSVRIFNEDATNKGSFCIMTARVEDEPTDYELENMLNWAVVEGWDVVDA